MVNGTTQCTPAQKVVLAFKYAKLQISSPNVTQRWQLKEISVMLKGQIRRLEDFTITIVMELDWQTMKKQSMIPRYIAKSLILDIVVVVSHNVNDSKIYSDKSYIGYCCCSKP